jgi:type VI secretion system protein ImpF
VLDRLLDDDPTASRETPKTRTQVLRELKQSVRRDLENLLNTRRRAVAWPEEFEELRQSLLGYGLPDITGSDLGSVPSREQFRRVMEQVIRQFEPRLKHVSVEMLENLEPIDRTLRFRIDALLHVEPAPEPVVFDSAMQQVTGDVEVKGASR